MNNLKQNLLNTIRSNYGSISNKDIDSIRDLNNFSSDLSEDKEENKEATSSGSAGGYSAPLFGGEMSEEDYCEVCGESKCVCNDTKKVEATEATTSSSSGQYSGPSFLAKSQKKKDFRGAAKPLYKGGKFVEIKKKCLTFPYCNQGDINNLKLTELDVFESIVKKLSLEYKIDENIIKKLIREDILKNKNT